MAELHEAYLTANRIFHAQAGDFPEVNPHHPLVVCDVDEVVLSFLAAFENWLGQRDLWLARDSFALNGNVRKTTGLAVSASDLRSLLHGFFAECAHDLPPLPGAIESLKLMESHVDIVFMSNLPFGAAAARRKNLDHVGLAQALIVNEGPKGPTLVKLTKGVAAPVIFLDDSPKNVASCRDVAPHITTIHLVPDPGFRQQIEDRGTVDLFTGDWSEAARYIMSKIENWQLADKQ